MHQLLFSYLLDDIISADFSLGKLWCLTLEEQEIGGQVVFFLVGQVFFLPFYFPIHSFSLLEICQWDFCPLFFFLIFYQYSNKTNQSAGIVKYTLTLSMIPSTHLFCVKSFGIWTTPPRHVLPNRFYRSKITLILDHLTSINYQSFPLPHNSVMIIYWIAPTSLLYI